MPSGDDLKNYGSTKTICAVLDKLGVKYQKRTPMSGLIEKVIANWNGVVNEEVQKKKGVTKIEFIVELAKLGVTEATKDGKVKKINDRNFKIGELQKMYEEKKAEEEDEDEGNLCVLYHGAFLTLSKFVNNPIEYHQYFIDGTQLGCLQIVTIRFQ